MTRVLDQEITYAGRAPAPADVAAIFGLPEGTEMVTRRRVLSDATGPVEVGASWLRVDEFADTVMEVPQLLPQALFLTAEEICGRRYMTAIDRFTVRSATPEEAETLRIRPDTPVLQVVHAALDEDRVPIEVSTSVWPAARVVVEDEYPIAPGVPVPADPSEV